MFMRMSNIPLRRKFKVRVTSISFSMVNYLNRQKCTQNITKEDSSYLFFVIQTHQFNPCGTMFVHCPTSCWNQFNSCLIPQFRISSGGISSISTVVTKSSKNSLFLFAELASEYLAFAVFPFLWTKIIRLSKECAQCLFNSMWPPNSLTFALSMLVKIPRAAAVTTWLEILPPASQTLFVYVGLYHSIKFFTKKNWYLLLLAWKNIYYLILHYCHLPYSFIYRVDMQVSYSVLY